MCPLKAQAAGCPWRRNIAEEFDFAAIFFTAGEALHAPEQFGAGEGYRHAVDFVNDETLRGFLVVDAGGLCHEIYKDFIGYAHGSVFFDFVDFKFLHAAVRKCGESLVKTCLIFQVGVDENVDVCGVPPEWRNRLLL